MIEVEESTITISDGLNLDYRGSLSNKRQITIMSKKDWDIACQELKVNNHWTTRRANLLIDDLDLFKSVGKKIKIGNEVLLEITGETKPCYRMDEQVKGLMMILMKNWRGGVTCKVIQGGKIKLGYAAQIID
jgi:MOSC domain-containing protein YiiM